VGDCWKDAERFHHEEKKDMKRRVEWAVAGGDVAREKHERVERGGPLRGQSRRRPRRGREVSRGAGEGAAEGVRWEA